MLTFLRDLMAHAEWADAVFFHTWGKSPARAHEELRQRVGHILGVQQGFLSIFHGEPPGGPPGGPPQSYDDLKTRAETCHVDLRTYTADLEPAMLAQQGAHPVVSGPAVPPHDRRGAGAGGHAHAASSRPVHDAAQGFRRRTEERGLDHLAMEGEAAGAVELRP